MEHFLKYWARFGRPVVLGEGKPDYPWWIVGEALGEYEEEHQRPFYPEAPAGSLFRSVIRQAKLETSPFFVTNIYPIRPPDNKLSRLPELGINRPEAIDTFKRFIAAYKPERVLLLGNTPLDAMFGQTGIEDWRGSPFKLPWGGWSVATLHPSNIQRKYDPKAKDAERGQSKYTYGSGRMSMVLDTVKCFSWKSLEPPKITVHTDYSVEEALGKLIQWREKPTPLAFDIETLGDFIDLIGFADSPAEAWVYPLTKKSWTFTFWNSFERELRALLDTHPYLIGQNGAFDCSLLMRHGFGRPLCWFDTRLAQAWVYPDLPGDLHYMVSQYSTHPHYKWMIENNRMRYNGLDCALTFEVFEALQKRIKRMEEEK